ncbi:MAG: DUF481 domain-containing protein [Planctomycetota bacterium]
MFTSFVRSSRFAVAGCVVVSSALPVWAQDQAADAVQTLDFKGGDRLTGTVVNETETTIVIQHDVLGQITVNKDQLVGGDGGAGDSATPTGSEDGQTLTEQSAQAFADFVDSWFFPGWDKSVAAGFTGTDGNSETLNIYASINTGYEDEQDRWSVDAKYFRNSTDGEATQDQFKGVIIKDWLLLDSDWFYWAQGTAQYDRFTDYETRLGGFLGAGYELIDDDVHQVLLRGGVGAQYEFGEVNELTPEAMVGIDWNWAISETQGFTFYNYLYPALDPFFGEFRNLTGATYEVALAAGRGLKLQLGVENEYNSDVDDGFEENDLKYFGALAFDF